MEKFYDDGMEESERQALEAALNEAIAEADRGEGMTWEESEVYIRAELARRKRDRAA